MAEKLLYQIWVYNVQIMCIKDTLHIALKHSLLLYFTADLKRPAYLQSQGEA